jgi:hypothetical protein
LARKFLYVVAVLIVFVIGAGIAYRYYGNQLMRWAMTPSAQFEAQPAVPADAYADPKLWLARPDKPGNPALWLPPGVAPTAPGAAAVFFIHPTSYLDKAHWNAPLNDAEANGRAALFLQGQASAFSAAGAIWAPRYRQATFGAFLTDQPAAGAALDLAYRDVDAAFTQFLKEAGDRPIILAGHSQGALHLTRLLRDRVANQPLAKRIVAAYVVGWPVSRTVDLPRMGLAECKGPDQTGCILSWQSFGEDADTSLISDTFDATVGLTGVPRRGTPLICTNPLTGGADGDAPASANLGTLFPSADLTTAELKVGQVGARCFGRGFLSIGTGPDFGQYVLPGANYHVFDYSLFWGNVRADAVRRLKAFQAK